jgi:hypothetical protein
MAGGIPPPCSAAFGASEQPDNSARGSNTIAPKATRKKAELVVIKVPVSDPSDAATLAAAGAVVLAENTIEMNKRQ